MLNVTMKVDESRYQQFGSTGILVRAQRSTGEWVNADIADLTKESLDAWLRSRGGDNPWAEATVAIMLGHR